MMVRLHRNIEPGKQTELGSAKMVSTRGVKFKFSEGEKVLCYEPDPTKAKVLYESKVLELVVSRDSRGRKVPEYLIHFFGWNSSWDRCVPEDFILPDNEENRALQKKSAEEAAQSLKGKRKKKLPAIIKETLNKKVCVDSMKKENTTLPKKDSSSSSEPDTSEDEDVEKIVDLEIPSVLKEKLEDDCCLITKKNKVVRVPCEPNVVSILEAFVKHLAVSLLCTPQPKGPKHQNDSTIPEDVETRLQLCREVMDGLRIYFDFTLPHLLLYQQEQQQYHTVSTVCRPIGGLKREGLKSVQAEDSQDETVVKCISSHPNSSPLNRDSSPPKISSACSSLPSSPSRNKTTQRPSHLGQNNILQNQTSLEIDGTTNGGTSPESPKLKNFCRSSQLKESTNQSLIREKGDKHSVPSRRSLRSTSKSENVLVAPGKIASKDYQEEESLPSQPDSPVIANSASPTRPSRTCLKNTSSEQNMSPCSTTTSGSLQGSSNPFNNYNANSNMSQQSSLPPPLNFSSISNSFSSSASSTHSSLSSPKLEKPVQRIFNPSGMLSEILSWNMLPSYLYEQIPAPPSLVYGAHHFLRLFVKLPELIHRMNMPRRKLVSLMDYIERFLQYLAERHDELFPHSAYVDASEVVTNTTT